MEYLLTDYSGGSVIPFPVREKITSFNISLVSFKRHYYYLYEEDLSNFLCQTNTIITKN